MTQAEPHHAKHRGSRAIQRGFSVAVPSNGCGGRSPTPTRSADGSSPSTRWRAVKASSTCSARLLRSKCSRSTGWSTSLCGGGRSGANRRRAGRGDCHLRGPGRRDTHHHPPVPVSATATTGTPRWSPPAAASRRASPTSCCTSRPAWPSHAIPGSRAPRGWSPERRSADCESRRSKPAGFADQLGFQPGDVLVELGGAAVFGHRELWFFMRQHQPGDEAEAAWVRDGQLSGVAPTPRPSAARRGRRRHPRSGRRRRCA